VQGKTSWQEIFNSDDKSFWGTGVVYNPTIPCFCVDPQNNWYELTLQLPALSAVVLK
jgi:1,4-alpha-glucan branching enzyme